MSVDYSYKEGAKETPKKAYLTTMKTANGLELSFQSLIYVLCIFFLVVVLLPSITLDVFPCTHETLGV